VEHEAHKGGLGQQVAIFSAVLATDPKKVDYYQAEARRYSKEKDDIRKVAEKHEAKAKEYNEKSDRALHPHHSLSISMTLLQIAIALASITVLTQKRWLLYGAAFSGFAGAVHAVVAYLI
jgi:hypothetical protein